MERKYFLLLQWKIFCTNNGCYVDSDIIWSLHWSSADKDIKEIEKQLIKFGCFWCWFNIIIIRFIPWFCTAIHGLVHVCIVLFPSSPPLDTITQWLSCCDGVALQNQLQQRLKDIRLLHYDLIIDKVDEVGLSR